MSSRAVGLILVGERYVPAYWESLRWDSHDDYEVITGDIPEFLHRTAPDYWVKAKPGRPLRPIEWHLMPPNDVSAITRKLIRAQKGVAL